MYARPLGTVSDNMIDHFIFIIEECFLEGVGGRLQKTIMKTKQRIALFIQHINDPLFLGRKTFCVGEFL